MTALRLVGFVLSRLAQPFLVLWLVFTLIFLVGLVSDTSKIVPSSLDPSIRERLLADLGLTGSPIERYVNLLRHGLTVDFGQSLTTRRPALELVADRIGPSFQLLGASSLVAAIAGIPLAIGAAFLRRRPWSAIVRWPVTIFASLPGFVIAVMLLWGLAIQLKLVPITGTGTPQHFIVPALALGVVMIPTVVRAGRGARGAWSTGSTAISRTTRAFAAWLHPFLVDFGLVFSTLIVVETLLAWPGVGRLLIQATVQRDLPILLTFASLLAWSTVVLDLIANVFLGLANPRASQVAINAAEYGPTRDDQAVGRVSWWRMFAMIPGLLFLLVIILAAFSAFVPPVDPVQQNLGRGLQAPGPGAILGTDQLGRDIFSRLLVSTQETVLVGIVVALGALVVGGTIGGLLGGLARFGFGWIGTPLVWYARAVRALPALFWLLLFVAFFGPGLISVGLVLVLALAVPVAGFVSDLILVGAPAEAWAGIDEKAVPTVGQRAVLLAGAWSLLVASAMVLFESANLIGVGVPPPTPTLGSTIANGIQMIQNAPWIALPSVAGLVLCVLAFTLIADTLADVTALKRAG